MAYSAAALSSAETTGFDNDKPMMVVQSVVQDGASNDAHWTFTGNNTGTDRTDADYPASRAYDDIGSLQTKPIAAGAATVSGVTAPGVSPVVVTANSHGFSNGDMVFFYDIAGMTDLNYVAANHNIYEVASKTTNTFQLSGVNSTGFDAYGSGGRAEPVKFYNIYTGSAAASEISFDTLLLLNHNFSTTSNVLVEIADNAAFSSNKIEIARHVTSGATDTGRWLITNLNSAGSSSTYSAGGTAQRYSGVNFVRLVVVGRYADVGEIFLGTRYQLQRNPDIPWNNKNEASLAADYVSNSGITKRYTFYRGQALRTFQASIAAAAEITVIDGWFNAINEGTRPFVYIETPSSSAQAIVVILDDAGLNFPLVGPTERRLAFSMTEQPPFLSRE